MPEIAIAFVLMLSPLPIPAVPKLTVTEDSDSLPFHNEIGPTEYGVVVPSIPHPCVPQHASQQAFGLCPLPFVGGEAFAVSFVGLRGHGWWGAGVRSR